MQKSGIKLTTLVFALALALLAVTAPAFADGGSTPMDATDGRYKPMVGDRVVLYVSAEQVDVWGIDGSGNGVYLTTFSAAELASGNTITRSTPEGTVTLRQDSPAEFVSGYKDYNASDTITEATTDAQYTVAWTGGNYGADGVGAFAKTFEATYQ